ncbi:hypothetical protein Ctob_010398 [Chrysochromulina tobinii]|uniref:Uncharacterized protein n=1 Tax=Chrysochromulina tobinii TaxID=1460289 RepID=A0A0M0LQ81_9EUKA|nr:hypothetical protein Ctob_010398 [Chrysochromulina tobinii]|eukprot:KOO53225.1 hypothetical protein Ctob_010398 [Chrysochromulina sp. CCMP291]
MSCRASRGAVALGRWMAWRSPRDGDVDRTSRLGLGLRSPRGLWSLRLGMQVTEHAHLHVTSICCGGCRWCRIRWCVAGGHRRRRRRGARGGDAGVRAAPFERVALTQGAGALLVRARGEPAVDTVAVEVVLTREQPDLIILGKLLHAETALEQQVRTLHHRAVVSLLVRAAGAAAPLDRAVVSTIEPLPRACRQRAERSVRRRLDCVAHVSLLVSLLLESAHQLDMHEQYRALNGAVGADRTQSCTQSCTQSDTQSGAQAVAKRVALLPPVGRVEVPQLGAPVTHDPTGRRTAQGDQENPHAHP